jgi:hypothetical protein
LTSPDWGRARRPAKVKESSAFPSPASQVGSCAGVKIGHESPIKACTLQATRDGDRAKPGRERRLVEPTPAKVSDIHRDIAARSPRIVGRPVYNRATLNGRNRRRKSTSGHCNKLRGPSLGPSQGEGRGFAFRHPLHALLSVPRFDHDFGHLLGLMGSESSRRNPRKTRQESPIGTQRASPICSPLSVPPDHPLGS